MGAFALMSLDYAFLTRLTDLDTLAVYSSNDLGVLRYFGILLLLPLLLGPTAAMRVRCGDEKWRIDCNATGGDEGGVAMSRMTSQKCNVIFRASFLFPYFTIGFDTLRSSSWKLVLSVIFSSFPACHRVPSHPLSR